MPTNEITNSDDVIDSRDIIARIEELDAIRADLDTLRADAETDVNLAKQGDGDTTGELALALNDATQNLTEWDHGEEGEELAKLKAFAEEAEGYAPDWIYGATLISESYFVAYCQDLINDIGDLPRGLPNYIVIDWEATARNLKVDYTEVDFDGQTYLVR